MKNFENYELFEYLLSNDAQLEDDGPNRLPPLVAIGQQLGVGVSRLREQLEVARALGFVDVKPRTGIRRLPYTFYPAVKQSIFYAIGVDRRYFEMYADFRNHIEAVYWYEAVQALTADDREELQSLIVGAWQKLRGPKIQIPHDEHRQLHLGVYRRLDNPFVIGILEAYWEAYEAVGLNLFTDYDYLQQVWNYHQEMVRAISERDYEKGFRALVEHKDLLYHRPLHETYRSNLNMFADPEQNDEHEPRLEPDLDR